MRGSQYSNVKYYAIGRKICVVNQLLKVLMFLVANTDCVRWWDRVSLA